MTLTTTVQSALVSLSRAALPSEACGFINPTGDVIALPNISDRPTDTFEMRWSDVSPFHGAYGYALWHSHPRTRAALSLDDQQAMHLIQLPMIVVSLMSELPIIRCFTWSARGPIEVCSYRVPDSPLQKSHSVVEALQGTDRSVNEEDPG